MDRVFGPDSTSTDVLSGIDLRSRRALVTGTSAGLGVETARALVARGADVVGTARDLAKAEAARDLVEAEASAGGGSFALQLLDLASLTSVRDCADRLRQEGRPFDLVVANAGVMATPFGRTADGFETQFGTNHLGHFALVAGLVPLLRPGARVVVVSSAGHRFADVDMDDPNFERRPYDPWIAYGGSKTANILFAVAFDERFKALGVRAAAVHPGAIQTDLGRHVDPVATAAMIRSINEANAAAGLPSFRYKSVEQGAATALWAAVKAEPDEVGGRYCEDCHVAELQESQAARGGVREYALDRGRADRLWTLSERLTVEHTYKV